MALVQWIRGLFGSGRTAKRAASAARREEQRKSDDAFRKAVKG